MSDEVPKKTVLKGEVLPPARQEVRESGLPPGTPFGIPMLARAKYEAQARAMQAYIESRRTVRAELEEHSRWLGAARENVQARERLATALQRHKHLDKILLAEEAALLSDLDDVFEEVGSKTARKRDAQQIEALRKRVTLADLEAAAVEAEARLERVRNPPVPPVDPDANLSHAQRVAREIARVKKDFEELREALIKAAGGPDNLTEDDRAQLDTLSLAAENKIREIMENL